MNLHKKVILIATIGLFGLISCKKDYTCTCTESYDNGSTYSYDTKSYPITSGSEKEAKETCGVGTTQTAEGTTKTCELK